MMLRLSDFDGLKDWVEFGVRRKMQHRYPIRQVENIYIEGIEGTIVR